MFSDKNGLRPMRIALYIKFERFDRICNFVGKLTEENSKFIFPWEGVVGDIDDTIELYKKMKESGEIS